MQREIDPGKRAGELLEPAPNGERTKVDAGEADFFQHPLKGSLGRGVVTGDNSTVRGLLGDVSAIHAMGTLLNASTTRAPRA